MTILYGLLGSLGFPSNLYRLRNRISTGQSVSIYFRIMMQLLRGLKGNFSCFMVAEWDELLRWSRLLFSEWRLAWSCWKYRRHLLIRESSSRNWEQIIFPWLLEIRCCVGFPAGWQQQLGDIDDVNRASVRFIYMLCSLIIQWCNWGIWKIVSWRQRSLLHRERIQLERGLMSNLYNRILTDTSRFSRRLGYLTSPLILWVHPL